MSDFLIELNRSVNAFVWGMPAIVAIVGVGLLDVGCSALLGMATKFSEVALAVRFRERNGDGEWVGGPMYSIKNGLGRRWMWLAYVYSFVGVLVARLDAVPSAFVSIFEGAFSPKAVTGGAVGSLFLSLQKGVSRGIFSNEAGLGSGSIAHACADTDDAVGQGYFGIFEVFMDTIVICTLTALVILVSGAPVSYGQAAGAELTISGFTEVYGGWGSLLTAVAICFFAFSTTQDGDSTAPAARSSSSADARSGRSWSSMRLSRFSAPQSTLASSGTCRRRSTALWPFRTSSHCFYCREN